MLRQFTPSLRQPSEREDGPTIGEYALILVLIILACVAAVTVFRGYGHISFASIAHAVAWGF
jgi:Flp pilus assembly pilin Flp